MHRILPMHRPGIRSLLSLVLLLAIYYAIPQGVFSSTESAVLSILFLVGGGGLLSALIMGQIQRQLRPGADALVELQSLLLLAYLGVIVFALGYFYLARSTDQFSGLETKTDGLYFTVSTLGTVGFGDIHPVGQAARAIVTAQIVFNLVFLGALARLLTGQLQMRVAARRAESPEAPPAASAAAPPASGSPEGPGGGSADATGDRPA
jgi:voltage-gated potassium channel